jgi:hypothetical protein
LIKILLLALGLLLGFLIGAFSAFILGKRFLRKESQKVYERWLRRERARSQAGLSHLAHDIKNPLFLIQAMVWTYRDHFQKAKDLPDSFAQSSEKMYESVNKQTAKALQILKSASQGEDSFSLSLTELWDRLAEREGLGELLSKFILKTSFPSDLTIRSQVYILEEGLEDLFETLLKSLPFCEVEIELKPEGDLLAWKIFFPSASPALETFKKAKTLLDVWTDKSIILFREHHPAGIAFKTKA